MAPSLYPNSHPELRPLLLQAHSFSFTWDPWALGSQFLQESWPRKRRVGKTQGICAPNQGWWRLDLSPFHPGKPVVLLTSSTLSTDPGFGKKIRKILTRNRQNKKVWTAFQHLKICSSLRKSNKQHMVWNFKISIFIWFSKYKNRITILVFFSKHTCLLESLIYHRSPLTWGMDDLARGPSPPGAHAWGMENSWNHPVSCSAEGSPLKQLLVCWFC